MSRIDEALETIQKLNDGESKTFENALTMVLADISVSMAIIADKLKNIDNNIRRMK